MEMFGATVGHNMESASAAVKKLGDDAEHDLGRVVKKLDETSTSSDHAKRNLIDLGREGIRPTNLLIGVAVAVAALLTPLLAYAAGLAAALAIGSLVLGGMVALGAAAVALAANYGHWLDAAANLTKAQDGLQQATRAHESAVLALDRAQATYNARPTAVNLEALHLAQAKAADGAEKLKNAQEALTVATAAQHNPLQTLIDDAQKMANTLGEAAVPAATELLKWLDSLLPTVERLGKELISWFQDRLPQAIPLATHVFNDFVTALEDLGRKVGPIFDEVLKHPETVEAAFKKAFGGTVDAIVWVIDRLMDLTKWWGEHGPELEKTASETMGVIAGAVVGLAQLLGQIATLFNQAEQAAAPALKVIGEGFQMMAPWIQFTLDVLKQLDPVIQFIKDHADSLRPVLLGVGVLLAFMAGSAVLTWAATLALIGVIVALVSMLSAAVDWLRRVSDAGGLVGIAFSRLGGWVHDLVGHIQDLVSWLGRAAYALGNLPSANIGIHIPGFQHGGTAPAGSIFRVGEAGPETGFALPGGGVMIVPDGGAGAGSRPTTVNIYVQGAGMSPDQVALAIDRRLSRMAT